jgi:hypothetical protein
MDEAPHHRDRNGRYQDHECDPHHGGYFLGGRPQATGLPAVPIYSQSCCVGRPRPGRTPTWPPRTSRGRADRAPRGQACAGVPDVTPHAQDATPRNG